MRKHFHLALIWNFSSICRERDAYVKASNNTSKQTSSSNNNVAKSTQTFKIVNKLPTFLPNLNQCCRIQWDFDVRPTVNVDILWKTNNFEYISMQHTYLDKSNCTPLAKTFLTVTKSSFLLLNPIYKRFSSNNYFYHKLAFLISDWYIVVLLLLWSHRIAEVTVFMGCRRKWTLTQSVFLPQCNRKSHNRDLSFLTCHSLCGITGSISPKLSAV